MRFLLMRKAGRKIYLVPNQNRGIFSVMAWRCLGFGWVETLSRVNGNINAQILRFRQWFLYCPSPSFSSWRFKHFLMPQYIGCGLSKKIIVSNHIKNISWLAQSSAVTYWKYLAEHDRYQQTLDFWQDVAKNYVRSLYKSIPRRIFQVVCIKRHLTKYKGIFLWILFSLLKQVAIFFFSSYLPYVRCATLFFLL